MGQLFLKKVRKSYGHFEVIKGVDLEVKDGEFVVFVGPSGCGKSTLLRMIAGLDDTTDGDIVIDGERVNDRPPVERGIAMVFQSYALYPHMSVFENIAFPLRVEKLPEEQIREKVGAVSKILQLDQRLQQRPGQLSGGQRGDTIVMDSPEVLAALQAYKDITPYSVEGATAYEQNEIRAIFLDGKVGMIQAGSGAAYRLKDTQINWGVAPLPQGPSAKGEGTLLITDSLAIFSGSGVEEKAIEFAKYITSTDIQHEYELQGGAGLTPLRPGPVVDEFVAKEPFWKPFIDGIAYGGPEPLFTDYKGFQNVMIEMVQSVVTGKAEPADALKKAAADLEQYK